MSSLDPGSASSSYDDVAPAPAVAAAAATAADTGLMAELARAYLLDRKRERRWRIFFRLSWLLFAVILVFTLLAFRTARRWVFYETEVK